MQDLKNLLIELFSPIDRTEFIYTCTASRNRYPPAWIFTNEHEIDGNYWLPFLKSEIELYRQIGYVHLCYVPLKLYREPKSMVYYGAEMIYRKVK